MNHLRNEEIPQDVAAHKWATHKVSTYSAELLNSRLVASSANEIVRDSTVKILTLDVPLQEKQRRIACVHAWLKGDV